MRAVRTLVVQKDREENASDLTSPAISVGRRTQCLSNRQPVGRYCAEIVLPRAVRLSSAHRLLARLAQGKELLFDWFHATNQSELTFDLRKFGCRIVTKQGVSTPEYLDAI